MKHPLSPTVVIAGVVACAMLAAVYIVGDFRAAERAEAVAVATLHAAEQAQASAVATAEAAEAMREAVELLAARSAGDVEPFVGPYYVDSFSVVIGTTATQIKAATGAQRAYWCVNDSATSVHVGDSGVTAAATSPAFCTTCTAGASWDANAFEEYAIVAAGTVTIACRALVERHEAP